MALACADSNKVGASGGSNRVTIPATPFQIRGGTGPDGATSVECRKCKIIAANGSSNIRVTFDVACTATTGIPVPEHKLVEGIKEYLELAVDDLNRLYFFGEAENDVVDILHWR